MWVECRVKTFGRGEVRILGTEVGYRFKDRVVDCVGQVEHDVGKVGVPWRDIVDGIVEDGVRGSGIANSTKVWRG